jgi:hypothetical protein
MRFPDCEGVYIPAVPKPLQLTLTARVILEALLERHTKQDCHFEASLEGGRILVLLESLIFEA